METAVTPLLTNADMLAGLRTDLGLAGFQHTRSIKMYSLETNQNDLCFHPARNTDLALLSDFYAPQNMGTLKTHPRELLYLLH